jgi:hypothetical protein
LIKETQRIIIPTVFTGKKDDPKDALKKLIKFGRKDLAEFHWTHIKDPELDTKLSDFEQKEVTTFYHFETTEKFNLIKSFNENLISLYKRTSLLKITRALSLFLSLKFADYNLVQIWIGEHSTGPSR